MIYSGIQTTSAVGLVIKKHPVNYTLVRNLMKRSGTVFPKQFLLKVFGR